jgi:hypothetical protein
LKKLYAGIIILVALSLFGQVYGQTAGQVQVQFSSVIVSSAQHVILATVTVDASSQTGLPAYYLITLKASFSTQNGFVFVVFQSVVTKSQLHLVHVFTVPFKQTGTYELISKVYAYPSMQLLATDPPAVGRD